MRTLSFLLYLFVWKPGVGHGYLPCEWRFPGVELRSSGSVASAFMLSDSSLASNLFLLMLREPFPTAAIAC